ncbi:MAG: RNA polymerase factor sigma-32 [Alphaproteobacteria bacterium]|nr:RNA polymerase factor sigma-32 [Alphaproteobacteria bacterium]
MAHIDDPQTQQANKAYIRQSMDAPLLEKEMEQDLARRWKDHGDEKALHRLIEAHMRLAVSTATRFRNYGLPMGDLIQEGNIGLMQAAERFDPDRDIRFSTYASWWIRAAIQDYVLRNWSIVRTGTTSAQKSLFFNLRRLRAKIENRREREGLDDEDRQEIAQTLKVRPQDVEAMEGRMAASDKSLDAPLTDESESSWQDMLADEAPSPEEIVVGMKDSQSRSKWLHDALSALPDREQTIIRQRHLDHETVTLEELGKSLGISKERVRQLEQRAMERMKASLVNRTDDAGAFFAE